METIKYDPVDFLDDNESIKAYLQEVIDDGDPKLISSAIYDVLRALKKNKGCCGIDQEKLLQALQIA